MSSKNRQQYGNHRQWYPPHHFLFLPLSVASFFGGLYYTAVVHSQRLEWLAITVAFFMIAGYGMMMRQHYALGNQNRIIRLEMRLRYYQLTHERFERFESQLSFGQIAALRFASDEELPGLLEQAISGNLSSDEIKRRIKSWNADDMRL